MMVVNNSDDVNSAASSSTVNGGSDNNSKSNLDCNNSDDPIKCTCQVISELLVIVKETLSEEEKEKQRRKNDCQFKHNSSPIDNTTNLTEQAQKYKLQLERISTLLTLAKSTLHKYYDGDRGLHHVQDHHQRKVDDHFLTSVTMTTTTNELQNKQQEGSSDKTNQGKKDDQMSTNRQEQQQQQNDHFQAKIAAFLLNIFEYNISKPILVTQLPQQQSTDTNDGNDGNLQKNYGEKEEEEAKEENEVQKVNNARLFVRHSLVGALAYTVIGIHKLLKFSGSHSSLDNQQQQMLHSAETINTVPPPPPPPIPQISVEHTRLCKFALGHLLRLAFLPLLRAELGSAVDRLLHAKPFDSTKPSSSSSSSLSPAAMEKCSPLIANYQQESSKLLLAQFYPIYLLCLHTLMDSSTTTTTATIGDTTETTIVCEALHSEYLPVLLATHVLYRMNPVKFDNDDNNDEMKYLKKTIHAQFSTYPKVAIAKQPDFVRALVLLNCILPRAPVSGKIVTRLKMYCLQQLLLLFSQPFGIELALGSLVDLDESSQQNTSIPRRVRDLARVIALMQVPKFAQFNSSMSEEEYCRNLVLQVVTRCWASTGPPPLLTVLQPTFGRSAEDQQRLQQIYKYCGARIICELYEKNKLLIKQMLFDSIKQCFSTENVTKSNNDASSEALVLNIDTALCAINQMRLARVCLDTELIHFVVPIFYARVAVEHRKTSSLRVQLDEMLIDLLLQEPDDLKQQQEEEEEHVSHSIYLLDNCLLNQQVVSQWLNRFTVVTDPDSLMDRIQLKNATITTDNVQTLSSIDQLFNLSNDLSSGLTFGNGNDNDPQLKALKTLATTGCAVLEKMPHLCRFQFFFILLDRLIEPNPPYVALEMIETLGERLLGRTITKLEEETREEQLLGNTSVVRFLCTTLERVVTKLIRPMSMTTFVQDDNDDAVPTSETVEVEHYHQTVELCLNTLKTCLAILEIILQMIENNPIYKNDTIKPTFSSKFQKSSKSNKSRKTIIFALRPCQTSLDLLLRSAKCSQLLSPEERINTEQLYEKLDRLLNPTTSVCGGDLNSDSHSAVQRSLIQLDHVLMPMRAHALITLKHLIYARDEAINVHFDQVLDALRRALQDGESYIYLAAINTLGALAIRHTDRVLDLLLDELIRPASPLETSPAPAARPLSVRLKVGEVILQLAHSIGDFSYHYSNKFIPKLLLGVKSTEPEIRISSLSCLGEFCQAFSLRLSEHIVELVHMVTSLIDTTTECIEVRRAAVLLLYLLLKGLHSIETVRLIESELLPIKQAIRHAEQQYLDVILNRHCSNANRELDRIGRMLLNLD